MDHEAEAVLWSSVLMLETVAASKYERDVPVEAFLKKRTFVEGIEPLVATFGPAPVHPVLSASETLSRTIDTEGRAATLLAQALTLESFGLALYTELGNSSRLSNDGQRCADAGKRVSGRMLESLPAQIEAANLGTGEILFAEYALHNGAVFRDLNKLSDAVDDPFAEKLGIDFDEILAEVSADICDRCIGLGMPRRELMSFVAGRFMTI